MRKEVFPMASKKRYAHVGFGGRSVMYTKAVVEQFKDDCEMVGLCDRNEGRLKIAQKRVVDEFGGPELPIYADTDFDKMIAETKPDVVIVTTMDRFHDEYVCRAMELGCDVITEKPMTIDEKRCQRIVDTQKKTGKKCTVTFNYRYAPPRTQVKDLLMSGVIGDVLSVDFQWLLNTHHGADYFRRWHRNKENSGGLMVHKATHHFDLVNWWLSAVPTEVFAMGHRKFYTPKQAERYGLTNRGDRCLTCPEKEKCAFSIDLESSEGLKKLYLDNEQYDGYMRDRCVFGDDIDIEDCMDVVVEYNTGAKLSYSLNAFTPWEGYFVAFNGSRGRIEHKCQESVYINGDGTVPGELLADGTSISVFPHFQTARTEEVWVGTGGHGGGDDPLLNDIFSPNPEADKYLRAADHRGGAYSILTGIAANHSMDTGKKIIISDLVQGIDMPDYPAMPSPDEPVPMPDKSSVTLTNAHVALEKKAEQEESDA
jgi:predicted dehydrogenase